MFHRGTVRCAAERSGSLNRKAFVAVIEAEKVYLLANGWELADYITNEWDEPYEKGRRLTFGHAVNSQKKRDFDELRYAKYRPLPRRRVRVGQVWQLFSENADHGESMVRGEPGLHWGPERVIDVRIGEASTDNGWISTDMRGVPTSKEWVLVYDPEETEA